jgi:hypothetical protein
MASVIVALLFVTPLLYLRLVGRALGWPAYIRVVGKLAVAVAIGGAVLLLGVGRDFELLNHAPLAIVGLVAAVAANVMLAFGALYRWRFGKFVAAVHAIRDDEIADEHIERITDFLTRSRPRAAAEGSAYATHVLFAVAPLLAVRRCADAERLLELVDAAWLTPPQRASYINALAVARLGQGDVQGAKRALEHAPETVANANQRRQLELLGALCASLTGEPERALELLAGDPDRDSVDPVLPHVARAHALAATGDPAGAREALLHGGDVIDAAIQHDGPATGIAEALRKEKAYR